MLFIRGNRQGGKGASSEKKICHIIMSTGCPRKNALLCSKAYSSSFEAAIRTSRGSFQILQLQSTTAKLAAQK